MTTITNSRIRSQSTQHDGTILVTEEHELSDGRIITQSYYAQSEIDIEPILQARAAKIQSDLDARARVEAEANNYETPLTKAEFRDLYTLEEQGVIELQYATYLSNPAYTEQQKAMIAAGRAYFNDARGIYLSNPITIAGVQLHEALGWIATGRAAEILAGGV